ncbi:MAG: RNA polymerase sigma factor RpoD/SigA [Candidatus Paceibacterota bacterium]
MIEALAPPTNGVVSPTLPGSDQAVSPSSRYERSRPPNIDEPDSVSLYFSDIHEMRLLTREQEIELSKQIENGVEADERLTDPKRAHNMTIRERNCLEETSREGQKAHRQLTQANLRLVISIAKRYQNQGVPFIDLIQEGSLGLMKAVDRFDYHKGYRFSTYAIWWIRQHVHKAVADQKDTIRIPVHKNDFIRRVYATAQTLESALGRKPTNQEIADEMDVKLCKVEQAHEIGSPTISLDQLVGEYKDIELGALIEDRNAPDPSSQAISNTRKSNIQAALTALRPRHARVLELRYGLNGGREHTLKEIGERFGLTRERIRQIEKEALDNLRQPHRAERLRDYLEV